MPKARVSPKYQIVITDDGDRVLLRPGKHMQMIRKRDSILLVRDRPMSAYRGILRGMAASTLREKKEGV
ncbi:MAG TPA: AbrB family transcriptional regulator [Thermoanaerobaculia bacterium]|jgi:hypothetical protein